MGLSRLSSKLRYIPLGHTRLQKRIHRQTMRSQGRLDIAAQLPILWVRTACEDLTKRIDYKKKYSISETFLHVLHSCKLIQNQTLNESELFLAALTHALKLTSL